MDAELLNELAAARQIVGGVAYRMIQAAMTYTDTAARDIVIARALRLLELAEGA